MNTDLDRFNALVKSADLTAEQQRAMEMATQALLKMVELGPQPEGPRAAAAPGDVITAKAFWWGWHLDVPHDQVEPLLSNTEKVAEIVETALHFIPEVGALVALALKAYFAVMRQVVEKVDKGNGVYLSQTWAIYAALIASGGLLGPALVPVLFIPTTRK